ncbi:MAG: hypothetical protein AAF990_11945 [Bacteroidota bacterium]
MKAIYLYPVLALLFLNSCSYRYQVFDIKSEEVISETGDYFLYENDDLEIYYDYWTEGGYPVFKIHNRRNDTLFLNLAKSNFKVNGVAIDYYNTTYTAEEYERMRPFPLPPVVAIQPRRSYQLNGFPISWRWERIKNKPGYVRFEQNNSPIHFGNFLTYYFDDENIDYRVENNFWIGKIKKYKRKEFNEFKQRHDIKSNKFYVYRYDGTDSAEFWADTVLSVMEVLLLF